MKENNIQTGEVCTAAKKNGIAKYIIAALVCILPILAFWAITAILNVISTITLIALIVDLILAVICLEIFAISMTSATVPALSVIFGILGMILYILIFPFAIISNLISDLLLTVKIVFPLLYILLMIFPTLLLVKGKALCFKQNKTALITAICVGGAFAIISTLYSVFSNLSMGVIYLIALELTANLAISIGLFLFVLMIFMLVKNGKCAKTGNNDDN